MHGDATKYNKAQAPPDKAICQALAKAIDRALPKEKGLKKEGTFKAAEARYTAVDDIDTTKLARWLAEAREVQWDYWNLVRRKGRLVRLK